MMWYTAGRVMRRLRQKANQRPRWVAHNLGISNREYKRVERGELRLSDQILVKWCTIVALGCEPASKAGVDQQVKLTPEQEVMSLGYLEAVRRAQHEDHDKRMREKVDL